MTHWTKEELTDYTARRQAWKGEKKKMIVGIDPGQKGGLAFLSDVVRAYPMPLAGKELDIPSIIWLINTRTLPGNLSVGNLAVVEKCHAMPGQGTVSMFKFGKGYGTLLGILGALKIPTILVTPQAWKKVILAGTKKDKDAAVEYVRMKYPDFNLILSRCRKPHDGMADAICLAEYGLKTQP